MILEKTSNPDKLTVGDIGDIWSNTLTEMKYKLVSIITGSDDRVWYDWQLMDNTDSSGSSGGDAGGGGNTGTNSNADFIGMVERTATEITIPEGCTKIGQYTFYYNSKIVTVNLPESITEIGFSSFNECTNLENINLPNGITAISNNAFQNCSKLSIDKLPENLEKIYSYAFGSIPNLTITELPEKLTSIKDYAFVNCIGITSLTFKSKPTAGGIASTAFANCTNLRTINVPWAEGAVYNAPWGATNATINYNYTGE